MELVFSLELSFVLKILLFGVSPFLYVDVMFIYLRDDNYVSNLADKMLSFQVFRGLATFSEVKSIRIFLFVE